MSETERALLALASDPEIHAAIDASREACTALRWHNALRRRTPAAAAESRVRGARASAACEGAEMNVDLVRRHILGVESWGEHGANLDPVEQVVAGAARATSETEHLRASVLTSPAGALARLHIVAAAGRVSSDELGRPRTAADDDAATESGAKIELADVGAPPPSSALPGRLAGVYEVISCHDRVPTLIVAAVAHAEIATMRPFVGANGVVARALERLIVQAGGLDPTGVSVPETGHLIEGATGYTGALAAYATGSPEGVRLWLLHCATAIERGALEGVRIADAVLAGRLS